MTYVFGPSCEVPGCGCPPWKDRLCSGHWRLQKGFGRRDNAVQVVRTRMEALALAGVAHLSDDFDRELRKWVDG